MSASNEAASRAAEPHPFIVHLKSLADDRAALAALRRGLGRPPGAAPEMHRYVIPRLPQGLYPRQEEAYYLVAALFGLHPDDTAAGNLGRSFAQARDQDGNAEAVERRFTLLLAAHPDDLPFQLRQAIQFLRSKEIAVNWSQLLRDVLNWDNLRRSVQRSWAHGFWERPAKPEKESDVTSVQSPTEV